MRKARHPPTKDAGPFLITGNTTAMDRRRTQPGNGVSTRRGHLYSIRHIAWYHTGMGTQAGRVTPHHSFIIPDRLIDEARRALELDEGVNKSYIIRLALVTVANLPREEAVIKPGRNPSGN